MSVLKKRSEMRENHAVCWTVICLVLFLFHFFTFIRIFWFWTLHTKTFSVRKRQKKRKKKQNKYEIYVIPIWYRFKNNRSKYAEETTQTFKHTKRCKVSYSISDIRTYYIPEKTDTRKECASRIHLQNNASISYAYNIIYIIYIRTHTPNQYTSTCTRAHTKKIKILHSTQHR